MQTLFDGFVEIGDAEYGTWRAHAVAKADTKARVLFVEVGLCGPDPEPEGSSAWWPKDRVELERLKTNCQLAAQRRAHALLEATLVEWRALLVEHGVLKAEPRPAETAAPHAFASAQALLAAAALTHADSVSLKGEAWVHHHAWSRDEPQSFERPEWTIWSSVLSKQFSASMFEAALSAYEQAHGERAARNVAPTDAPAAEPVPAPHPGDGDEAF